MGQLNVGIISAIFIVSAILGDAVNYAVGGSACQCVRVCVCTRMCVWAEWGGVRGGSDWGCGLASVISRTGGEGVRLSWVGVGDGGQGGRGTSVGRALREGLPVGVSHPVGRLHQPARRASCMLPAQCCAMCARGRQQHHSAGAGCIKQLHVCSPWQHGMPVHA